MMSSGDGGPDDGPSPRPPIGAGWYEDPAGIHRLRWWDGQQWSEQVRDDVDPPATKAEGGAVPRSDDPSVGKEARLLDAAPPPSTGAAVPEAAWAAPEQPSIGNADGDQQGRRLRRGLVRVATVTSVLAAMFLAGIAAGWQLFDERIGGRELATEMEPEVVEVRVPTLTGDPSVAVMPDVRGLTEELALEILADTVLAGEQPVRTEVPWAGSAGIVIEQRPAFGVRDPAGVELTLSVPATVPAAVGRGFEEVVQELEAVGASVEVERRFESGVDADEVLEIEPASGSPVPSVVRIVVSEPAGSVSLRGLDMGVQAAASEWCMARW